MTPLRAKTPKEKQSILPELTSMTSQAMLLLPYYCPALPSFHQAHPGLFLCKAFAITAPLRGQEQCPLWLLAGLLLLKL